MTCIVALTDGTNIMMGADSVGVGPYHSQQRRRDPKIFVAGDSYLMGFTSSFRMGQILMYAEFPEPPATPNPASGFRFMVQTFVPAVRRILAEGGYTKSIVLSRPTGQQETHEHQGGTFIVGFQGLLFEVRDDFAVGMVEESYCAVGASWQPALGALYATEALEVSQAQRVVLALEAAANHTGACRTPFRVLTLKGDDLKEVNGFDSPPNGAEAAAWGASK